MIGWMLTDAIVFDIRLSRSADEYKSSWNFLDLSLSRDNSFLSSLTMTSIFAEFVSVDVANSEIYK